MLGLDKSFAIAIKDLKEVFSNIGIFGPMLGIPMFFAVVLPIYTNYIATNAGANIVSKVLTTFVNQTNLHNVNGGNVNSIVFMIFFAVNVLGPVFLTMPIFTASVIAADSLVGEKERKTSEALLSMPVTTNELLVGKILASFIPAFFLTLAVFGIYGGITNYLSYASFQTYVLPTVPWLLMLVASPFLAIATIGIVVFVSSHVKNIKEAQQISTLLVLPILIMPFTSIFGLVDLSATFMLEVIAFLIVADIIVLYLSFKEFKKEALL